MIMQKNLIIIFLSQSISMDIDVKDVSIGAEFCQESANAYTPIIIKLLKLKGRCTVTVFSRERICNAKLEGWPEVILLEHFLRLDGVQYILNSRTYVFKDLRHAII